MIHLNYPFDKEVLFNSWKSTYHKYLKKMHEMIILNKKNLTEEETESDESEDDSEAESDTSGMESI